MASVVRDGVHKSGYILFSRLTEKRIFVAPIDLWEENAPIVLWTNEGDLSKPVLYLSEKTILEFHGEPEEDEPTTKEFCEACRVIINDRGLSLSLLSVLVAYLPLKVSI